MASINKTPNYGLNQWQGNEYPKRQDFVDDNLNTDTAIKAVDNSLVAHEAETVSHVVVITRDSALTGVQIVELPFKAKSLSVIAVKNKGFSYGFWAENGTQRAMAQKEDGGGLVLAIHAIAIYDTATKRLSGTIQNVTNTGFEIDWTNVESPTGTITIYILASAHGGV